MEEHGSQEMGAPSPRRAPPARADGGAPARAPGPEPAELPARPEEKPPHARKRPPRAILVAAALAVIAAVAWWLHGRGLEDTDDAAIDGDIVAVSSRVVGSVTAVHVVDNQAVQAGAVLVELDPTDLQVAVRQAEAAVAQAEAQIASDQPSVSITEAQTRSAVQQARADSQAARSQADSAQRALDEARANERLAGSQLDRARKLLAGDSISRQDFDQRETQHDVTVAAVSSAEKQLQAQQARLRSALSHEREVTAVGPGQLVSRQAFVESRRANLELASAQLHQAQLNLGYARVVAPANGIIGRLSVHVGERIQVGQQLMALTRTGDFWVTANFRETQVRRMRVGQPVEIHVDALGRDFRGRVESFAGATGSRYSLLPPENASGNYVKVVQRLPVRIRIDPGQPGLDLLRPGMSVEPSVDVR
jgi:membrane fusion protein (multidrug efflux system)